MIIPDQIRYVDPFADISSASVNKRLKSLIPNGRGCIEGLRINITGNNTFTITKGIGVKDWVVIDIIQDTDFTLTNVFSNVYVVLKYNYKVIDPPDQASLGYIDIASYNETDYLILGTLEIDNTGKITGVDYSSRDKNPISEQLLQEINVNGLYSNLDMHNYRILNLKDDSSPNSAVTKGYVDNTDGQVKVDSTDKVDFLEAKLQAGIGLTISKQSKDVDGVTTKDLQVSAPITQTALVSSADSSNSYL